VKVPPKIDPEVSSYISPLHAQKYLEFANPAVLALVVPFT